MGERRTGEELLFNLDRFDNDFLDPPWVWPPTQMMEEEAGKVGVHTLIAADQLVGKSQTGHEATFLEPKDGSKGAGKEDTLYSSEGNETLGKDRVLVRYPAQGPLCLLLDAWDGLDSIKEVFALRRVFDVGVDEKRVGLRVDVLPINLLKIRSDGKLYRVAYIIIWKP